MPGVSKLQECTSPISPHYGIAMALLSLGNGCNQCNYPEGVQWARVHTGGHRLFYQVGGGMFLQECHPSRSHPVCEEQHHLPLWDARNAHHRQRFQLKQPHDGPAMPAVQDPAPQLCPIPPEDEWSRRAANKNVKQILSKMTETYKDWHEQCHTLCAPTGRQ
jgi:hypothetical protein